MALKTFYSPKKVKTWQKSTLIDSWDLTESIKLFRFKLEKMISHKAGQHYDFYIENKKGEKVIRSYSIASSPYETQHIDFGVELIKNGELSPFFFSLKNGQSIHANGPLGDSFYFQAKKPGELILIGGGSGIIPFIPMLHELEYKKDTREVILIISIKEKKNIAFKNEIERLKKTLNLKVHIVLTKRRLDDPLKRIGVEFLSKLLSKKSRSKSLIYISGSTQFVESVSDMLFDIGFKKSSLNTERFGGE